MNTENSVDRANKITALTALCLTLPLPSLGAVFAMILYPGSVIGQSVFAACKALLLILPVVWHLGVNRGRLSLSPPRHGGFLTALAAAMCINGSITACFLIGGDGLIDAAHFKSQLRAIGLDSPAVFIAGALYWIVINAILEEYVWRWFIVQEASRLGGRNFAVLLSAFVFVIHHAIAMQVYFAWPAVTIACTGIFIGAITWSWLYARYRSLWPAYLCHALIDACIFAIGYYILFLS